MQTVSTLVNQPGRHSRSPSPRSRSTGTYTLEVEDDVDDPGQSRSDPTDLRLPDLAQQRDPEHSGRADPRRGGRRPSCRRRSRRATTTYLDTHLHRTPRRIQSTKVLLSLSLTAVDVSMLTIVVDRSPRPARPTPFRPPPATSINRPVPAARLPSTVRPSTAPITVKITAPANDVTGTPLRAWSLSADAAEPTTCPRRRSLPMPSRSASTTPLSSRPRWSGTNTSMTSIFLVGHPGKTLEEGTVTVNLNLTNTVADGTDVSDLTIVLENPSPACSSPCPRRPARRWARRSHCRPSFIGQGDRRPAITLFITGSKAERLPACSPDGRSDLVAQGLNGNSMDQNADGTGGEDQETTRLHRDHARRRLRRPRPAQHDRHRDLQHLGLARPAHTTHRLAAADRHRCPHRDDERHRHRQPGDPLPPTTADPIGARQPAIATDRPGRSMTRSARPPSPTTGTSRSASVTAGPGPQHQRPGRLDQQSRKPSSRQGSPSRSPRPTSVISIPKGGVASPLGLDA